MTFGAALAACGGGGGGGDAVEGVAVPEGASTVSASSTTAGGASPIVAAAPVVSGSAAASTDGTAVASASATEESESVVASAASVLPAATLAGTPGNMGGGAIIRTAAVAPRSGVGTNLNQVSYYSPEMPTIDLMKKASTWLTQCVSGTASCNKAVSPASGWDTLEESALDLDADGWVRSLPAANSTAANYRYVTTAVLSNGYQQAGKYVVLYDGSGTITYSGVGVKSASESTPGRDVVNVAAGTAGWFMSITATTPSNYLRNIRIYAPGGACANDMTTYVAASTGCATAAQGAFVPSSSPTSRATARCASWTGARPTSTPPPRGRAGRRRPRAPGPAWRACRSKRCWTWPAA
jgi:hypothetical protein